MIEWLVALVIGILVSMVIYSIAFAVMMTLVKRVQLQSKVTHSLTWFSSAIVSPVILCLSLLAIYLISTGMLPLWGFQIPSLEVVVQFSIVGLMAAIVVVLMSEYFSPTPEKMNPPSDLRGRITFFVVIVLLASIGEEMLFRGFLQNILDTTLILALDLGLVSITSGAILSAIVFGLIHIAPAKQMNASIPVLVGSAFILGLIAGISLTISGSILLPVLIHIEFNAIGFLLGIRKS